ncbi:peptidylprolyl isomerase [Thalassolituus sp. UBA3500]|uniref:peptidylprolyl isomerase n=1 Tax=Thalassolituus sp. UBA3500 TaxID=1947664 RepID=UPI000B745B1A|nr:peptidylprolyl isomerase [Thalassolituus sp. UBA3500]MBN57889.1 molecular chaperone SurA [Oceanospirillaceae bacterium]OUX65696.1 MAG: molecular chaperone SurA [Oceanospirillaceae bacterium TMED276]|tara:strand:- start:747 stop:2051 length:1305 start_codon:yes stop_codon:yes gene_type:complete
MDTQDANTMTIKHLIFTLLAMTVSAVLHAAPQMIDRVVAVVDDDIIMESELEQRIKTVGVQNNQNELPEAGTLREQVLERMITESVQLQMADRAGIRISESQLDDAMGRIAAQNGMSLAEFQQAMASEGVSFAYAREQIRNEMRISRVQQYQVGERIQITDQDIDYFLASDIGRIASAAEYKLRHILISVRSGAAPQEYKEAEAKADTLVAELRNGADFAKTAMAESQGRTALNGGDMGWRKDAQLPSIFADIAPKMSVGDVSEPIRTASGFHIIKLEDKRGGNSQLIQQAEVRHILITPNEVRDQDQARELINQIYERLKAGADFAELAREYSDDPGSGASGGDLGWVSPGDMVPEFEQAMDATPTGELSTPVRSQFGWHVLQVTDRREADIGEEVQRNQVRQMLYGRRFEEELPIWLRKIRSEAYVDIKEQP